MVAIKNKGAGRHRLSHVYIMDEMRLIKSYTRCAHRTGIEYFTGNGDEARGPRPLFYVHVVFVVF